MAVQAPDRKKTEAPTRGRPSHRDDLLAAALRLFAAQGVRNTGIREITRAAGVSEAALYRHWKSKQVLAEALIQDAGNELTTELKAATADADAPTGKLAALIDTLFAYHIKQPEKFDLVVHVAHFERSMVNSKTALPSSVVLPVIRAGIRSKQFKKTEPELALAMLIGTIARTTQLMRLGVVKGSAARAGRQVREMILRALAV